MAFASSSNKKKKVELLAEVEAHAAPSVMVERKISARAKQSDSLDRIAQAAEAKNTLTQNQINIALDTMRFQFYMANPTALGAGAYLESKALEYSKPDVTTATATEGIKEKTMVLGINDIAEANLYADNQGVVDLVQEEEEEDEEVTIIKTLFCHKNEKDDGRVTAKVHLKQEPVEDMMLGTLPDTQHLMDVFFNNASSVAPVPPHVLINADLAQGTEDTDVDDTQETTLG